MKPSLIPKFVRPAAYAAACLFASAPVAFSQLVLGTSPSSAPQSLQAAKSSPATGGLPALFDIKSSMPKTGPLFQFGPVSFRPHILYRFSYGDGLLNPTQLERQSSIIHTTVAGFQSDIGRYLSVQYTLTNVAYSTQYLVDSVDHDLQFGGSFSRNNWSISLWQSYRTDSPILTETGQQTGQEFYSTTGSFNYDLGSRTQLTVRISRNQRITNSNIDTPDWTTTDWYSWVGSLSVGYRLSQRLEAAVGLDATRDEISQSADMTAVQPNLQIKWRPLDKVSLNAKAGAEYRKIEGMGTSDLKNPIYSTSLQYQPVATTSLSATLSQSVSASYFANLASKTTASEYSFSQRLLQKLFLTASYSTGRTEYISTDLSFINGRVDRFRSYNFRVSTPILKRASFAAFLQRGKNRSNSTEFRYTSDQFGVEIGYRY